MLRPNGCVLIVLGLALLASESASADPRWGTFKRDQCTSIGKRQWSARLWDIPWGKSWEAACNSTPADVNGQHFDAPSRCKNVAGREMWGEFDLSDRSCPHWGDLARYECNQGLRRVAAALLDVPPNVDAKRLCESRGNPNIDRTLLAGRGLFPVCGWQAGGMMWGVWLVSDRTCPIDFGMGSTRCQCDRGIAPGPCSAKWTGSRMEVQCQIPDGCTACTCDAGATERQCN